MKSFPMQNFAAQGFKIVTPVWLLRVAREG
jgi:hypothetical protein